MDKKAAIMAAFVAVTLMAVPAFLCVNGDDGADATTATCGTYTVLYNDGTGWGSQTVTTAFDAAQAVRATSVWQSGDSMAGRNTGGDWPSPNTDYGDITKFMDKTENNRDVWNVFVYDGTSWAVGQKNIGYYTCFDDYEAGWKTANIALLYGAAAETVPASLTAYIADNNVHLSVITAVDHSAGSDFQISLYLKKKYTMGQGPSISPDGEVSITAAQLSAGVTVSIYGSNLYAALKWAFGANVSGMDTVPGVYNGTAPDGYWTYYSWLNTLFGLGTVQTAGQSTPHDWTDDMYVWWVENDANGGRLPFVFGYYSPLDCAPDTLSSFQMIYAEESV